MEVPFYYSFKEFKENYETDLKNWLEIYTEGNEKDFLQWLKSVYSVYFVDVLGEVIPECTNLPNTIMTEKGGYNSYEISIDDFLQLIEKRIEWYVINGYKTYDEEVIDKSIFNNSIYTDNLVWNNYYYDYKETYYDGYKLNYYEYLKIRDFIEVEEDFFDYKLKFNHNKYQNFKLSIPKIYNFIQEKLNPKKTIENPKILPPDKIEPITLPEHIKTTKTDVIRLLHYTGILEFLRTKYPRMNESNLASFFELITKTPITHKNQNKHFYKNTDDSMYHKEHLDLILSKYNMIANDKEK